MQLQIDRAHLAALRVIADFAAERVREQLVAIADAEQRHAGVGGVVQPRRVRSLHSARSGDHRARAGHDGAREAFARRQRLAGLHVDHHRLVGAQPGGDPDPVRKATMATHGIDRLAGCRIRKGAFTGRRTRRQDGARARSGKAHSYTNAP